MKTSTGFTACNVAHLLRYEFPRTHLLAVAFALFVSAISSAQCVSVKGSWVALTEARQRLVLQLEQSPGLCQLTGKFFAGGPDFYQIEGNVSGTVVVINIKSEGIIWYLRGEAGREGLVLRKLRRQPPQWRPYATFHRYQYQ